MPRLGELAAGLLAVMVFVACGDDSTGPGGGGSSTSSGPGPSTTGATASTGVGGGAGGSVPETPLDACASGEAGTAGTHFVAPSGSGATGASWADAWPSLDAVDWAQITPNSTLCLGGGTYGDLSIQTSGLANGRVCIQRATASDPICGASSAGFSPSFDTTVVVSQISCSPGNCSYVTIDGRIPYAGIRVDDQTTTETYAVDLNQSGANEFHLFNVDVSGVSTLSTDFSGEGRALSANSSTTTHGLHVAYCQLHGKPTLVLTAGQHEMVFEHNKLFDNVVGNPAAWHPNVWVSVSDDIGVVWRFNDVRNWMVEGIMMCPNGPGCTPDADWYIYSNVWHDAPQGAARVLEAQYETAGPIFIYDNTFANLDYVMGTHANGGAIAGGDARNNLMWNTSADFAGWNISSSHDVTASADPFVDSGGGDYHLAVGSEPVNAGLAIRAAGELTFDDDFDGVKRGADGTWDVGAYELH